MRSSPQPPAIEQIGRYRLVTKLGEGGQAVVWRAVDTILGVERALKVLRRTPGADAMRRRLVDEARCLAQLAHPRVLQLYDLGETDDDLFIVMEVAPLGIVRRSQARSLEAAVRIGVQMLAALDAAHSIGIVHRDVKPTNVLQFPNGVVKLSDFGIAQLPKEELTPGRAIGTPQFCAPEQLYCDGPIDQRADIYAVASTLYALLSGRASHMLWRAPEEDALWKPIPGPLRPILRRATLLDAERRHPTARALAAELLAVATLSDRERDALWRLFERADVEEDPAHAALPALRDAYRAGLQSRIADLATAADALVAATNDTQDRSRAAESIRRHAHQVRGSGATYGFPRLSTLAGRVEDTAPESLLRDLAPLLDEMRAVSGSWPSIDRHVLAIGAWPSLELPARVRVSTARTFGEALAPTVPSWPGLLLARLATGDGDVRSFLRRLRSTPGGLGPAVVVVGSMPPAARSELLALGADDVVGAEEDLGALVERMFAGDLTYRKRRRILTTLRAHRSAFLERGRASCSALVVVEAEQPGAMQLLEDLLAARLPDRQAIAPWGPDAFLVAMEAHTLPSAELLLNVAVDQIRELLPDVRLGVGLLGPGDGLLSETVGQAEDLARLAVTTGEVLARPMEAQRPPRVVVCDDDASVRGALLAALESAGFVGIGFERGESMLERLSAVDAAAVVLDVSLPGIDGFQALRQLRAAHADLPVVMLTGNQAPDGIERAFDLGADDWVSKPFSPMDLLPRVRRLVAISRRRAAPEPGPTA